MSKGPTFENEAALVAAYVVEIERRNALPVSRRLGGDVWTAYHETAGWDLLLVGETGVQVGIEAKMSLNAKVLVQALPGKWSSPEGPDYRAVLVPMTQVQNHLDEIAGHLGITVIRMGGGSSGGRIMWGTNPSSLPEENDKTRTLYSFRDWHSWFPERRCKLPDYVPDVMGGKAAPVALTEWKIKAIKLSVLLDRRGIVTRADMKALAISPSRWTDAYNGFLRADRERGGYVRCGLTPDFRAQHPTNYAQIEADFQSWEPKSIVPLT